MQTEKRLFLAFSSANPYDVQAEVKLPWITNFIFKSFINLKMIFHHPIFLNKGLTWTLKQSVACMMLMLDVLIYC